MDILVSDIWAAYKVDKVGSMEIYWNGYVVVKCLLESDYDYNNFIVNSFSMIKIKPKHRQCWNFQGVLFYPVPLDALNFECLAPIVFG